MKPALSEKDRAIPVAWRQFNQGEALAKAIAMQLRPWWQQIFGYYLLKVGDLSCQIDTIDCKIQQHINVGMQGAELMLKAQPDA